MPSNKNALIRYYYLDEFLSNKHRYYTMQELTEKCNERLNENGFSTVTKRCIEKDIVFMQDAPFSAPIINERVAGKLTYRYEDPTFSIFKKSLSNDEKALLAEVFNTIGQFDGLDNFEWLNDIKYRLGVEERAKVIWFDNNPYLQQANMLGSLFEVVSHQVAIRLSYKSFDNVRLDGVIYYPYLLKQYNERWYLIGRICDNDYLYNLPIDRIESFEKLPHHQFVPYSGNLIEHFDDIIGITNYADKPIEHIEIWANNNSSNYIKTKPLHGSQRFIKAEQELEMRVKYPRLTQGSFFSIDCKYNYELIRELCSYGDGLIVLSPESIRQEVYKRVKEMVSRYEDLF